MPLDLGTRVGSLEIVRQLGEGGMGAVYLAHDGRLNRDVAIKVLPDQFARDPERLARFNREAQALAAFSHPHIAHVYGLEELNGTAALVMEYVPGRTLESILSEGRPLPLPDVVSIARQIAEGLEAAHEKNIVHRDLKPANIIVAADGSVKILDFGLAKGLDGTSSGLDLMSSPTMLSPAMTVQGVILGTAAYMSPEQARGRPVDKRSDVWAYGVVLWEMLTGHRPFAGDTVTDTLAAIIGTEPQWSDLPPNTPDGLRRLLHRCLDKDPHQRLRDIGEARIALQQPTATASSATSQPAQTGVVSPVRDRSSVVRRALPWVLAFFGVAFVFVKPLLQPEAPAATPVMSFDVDTPPGTLLRVTERPGIDISADGQAIAFTAISNDTIQVYVRRRDEAAARALPVHISNIRQGGDIAFSPDGKYLAFTDGASLMKVPLDGGPAVRLASVLSGTRGVAWADDHTIVYSPAPRTGLMAVDANGGEARELTKLSEEQNERSHRWPVALPGGKAILFTVGALGSPDSYDDGNIDALVLATGERKRVFTGASAARYAPGGKLIFARGPSLYAVDFDPDRLTVSGSPVLVLPRVATDPNTGATHFAVAQDGTLIYVPGIPSAGLRRLMWVNRDGAVQPIDLTPDVFNDPAVSPDGERAALLVGPIGHGDIWIYDFRQTTFTRLTTDGKSATPVWSADGRSIYYVSIDTPKRETTIFRRSADGGGEPERLASSNLRTYIGSVVRDGTAAFGAANPWTGSFNIFRIPLAGQPLVRLTNSQTQAYAPTLSPDGRWLAYSSEESGRREIYVQGVTGEAQWLVSVGGGEEPHWGPDGRALYYRVDDRLMSVAIQPGATFAAAKPTLLLRGLYDLQSETGLSYAVDPKTARFLMIRLATDGSGTAASSFRVVLNWAQHLRAAAQ
jgi:serine/threonine protein kinase/Tol biopolymer transport system component